MSQGDGKYGLIMEVRLAPPDVEPPEVWFRIGTAPELRDSLRPGSLVQLKARVRAYRQGGGYTDEVGDTIFATDSIQLDTTTLELEIIDADPLGVEEGGTV